jgi:hypothetical protein
MPAHVKFGIDAYIHAYKHTYIRMIHAYTQKTLQARKDVYTQKKTRKCIYTKKHANMHTSKSSRACWPQTCASSINVGTICTHGQDKLARYVADLIPSVSIRYAPCHPSSISIYICTYVMVYISLQVCSSSAHTHHAYMDASLHVDRPDLTLDLRCNHEYACISILC